LLGKIVSTGSRARWAFSKHSVRWEERRWSQFGNNFPCWLPRCDLRSQQIAWFVVHLTRWSWNKHITG